MNKLIGTVCMSFDPKLPCFSSGKLPCLVLEREGSSEYEYVSLLV